MITSQIVDVPADRKLTIDVPPDVPVGRPIVITFTEAEKSAYGPPRGKPVFGCAKGQFWMADDFDAPLEDLKDYM
jgi:hypothetical protein